MVDGMLDELLLAIGAIAFGYLAGSIPTAYLAGRWLRSIDLRQYGSGTVSGSMVWEHVAQWAVVPVGLFDIAKAAFPTWLAMLLGMCPAVAASAGMAAAVGHNWPLYLKFTGGRGLSPMLGVWLVMYPLADVWMLASLAIGYLFSNATWALAGLVTLPLLALVTGGPSIVTPIAASMLLLTLAKRLEANRRPLPASGPERRRVILRRIFLDRDIPSHKKWIRRTPEEPRNDDRSV
jgi:glycerol-3-phosphate acyltransferase PlsY